MQNYYIHQQDLGDGLIGPFISLQACVDHLALPITKIDGAALIGIYVETPGCYNVAINQLKEDGCPVCSNQVKIIYGNLSFIANVYKSI